MGDREETARLVEAVAGLEQAVSGIAVVLGQHGRMLRQLLDAATAEPEEETELHALMVKLIGRLDQQAGMLRRMEDGFGQVAAAVEKTRRGAGG